MISDNPVKFAAIAKSTWSPVIQGSEVGDYYWENTFNYFPEHQLFFQRENGDLIGFANTIPLWYNGSNEDLPDEGWDWMIRKGIEDYESQLQPNIVGGLQIGVLPLYRGQGYSKYILGEVKKMIAEEGYSNFILPIRPTLKHKYPEVEMEEYIQWTEKGKIFDPWIRVHMEAGAQIIKVCHKAMSVELSIAAWEKLLGYKITRSGKIKVEGALTLVDIQLDKGIGTYIEPNIWICYNFH